MVGIPSKLFSLYTRLYRRFALEPYPLQDSTAEVSTTIQPVTQADELLRDVKGVSAVSASISAGVTAWVTVLTVPEGVRWRLVALSTFRASGDNLADQLRINDQSESVEVILEAFTGTAVHAVSIGAVKILDQLDTIDVHVNGTGSGASTFSVQAWVEEESAYL